jgi:hypothetical protein
MKLLNLRKIALDLARTWGVEKRIADLRGNTFYGNLL